jgi:hypothetical protein
MVCCTPGSSLNKARRSALNIANYFIFISRTRVGVSGADAAGPAAEVAQNGFYAAVWEGEHRNRALFLIFSFSRHRNMMSWRALNPPK